MDTSNVLELLRDRLSLLVGVSSTEISSDTLFEELDVDSLMILELVAIVEQAIGHQLPEEDFSRFCSINDVRLYISEFQSV